MSVWGATEDQQVLEFRYSNCQKEMAFLKGHEINIQALFDIAEKDSATMPRLPGIKAPITTKEYFNTINFYNSYRLHPSNINSQVLADIEEFLNSFNSKLVHLQLQLIEPGTEIRLKYLTRLTANSKAAINLHHGKKPFAPFNLKDAEFVNCYPHMLLALNDDVILADSLSGDESEVEIDEFHDATHYRSEEDDEESFHSATELQDDIAAELEPPRSFQPQFNHTKASKQNSSSDSEPDPMSDAAMPTLRTSPRND